MRENFDLLKLELTLDQDAILMDGTIEGAWVAFRSRIEAANEKALLMILRYQWNIKPLWMDDKNHDQSREICQACEDLIRDMEMTTIMLNIRKLFWCLRHPQPQK